MSLLIRGMDLPSDCWSCKCKHGSGDMYFCNIMKGNGSVTCVEDYVESRHPNCPLIGIPGKHGPLIDADEVIKQFTASQEEIASFKAQDEVIADITEKVACIVRDSVRDCVPVIIEAEDGE